LEVVRNLVVQLRHMILMEEEVRNLVVQFHHMILSLEEEVRNLVVQLHHMILLEVVPLRQPWLLEQWLVVVCSLRHSQSPS
jgi:hypothetical protein